MVNILGNTKNTELYPTFKNGRFCKFCNKPIADHEHATRIFCERLVLPDGSIKNCKDDFWAEHRKAKEDEYSSILNYHKDVYEKLSIACYLGENRMTDQELCKLGIILSRRLEAKFNPDGTHSHLFIGHELIVYPNTNLIKIIKYDGTIY